MTIVVGSGCFTLLGAATAHAVSVRVCVSASNDPMQVWDDSPTLDGRDLLEDFGRLDQADSLRVPNMLTSVSAEGSRIWGWAPLDAEGCTEEFDAVAGSQVNVEVYFWSYYPDRNVSLVTLNCVGGGLDCTSGSILEDKTVPQSDGIIPFDLGTARRSYVHFAASVAESRVPIGHDEVFYTRTGLLEGDWASK